jgi:hypothetical protein
MKNLLFAAILLFSTCFIARAQRPARDTIPAVFRNLSEMKSAPAAALDTGRIYLRNAGGMIVQYRWNPAATGKDDSVTVIQRTEAGPAARSAASTGRFELYFENYIHANWFGAVPGDGKDDSWAIQKAINFAIGSAKNPVLQLSGGNYIVNNVVIGKKSGNEYDFVTLTLRGNTNLVSPSTEFACNNKNGFCLNIQRGRNVVIENISFIGRLPAITSIRQIVETSDADYTAGVIANQFSQHNAINIDAFHSSIGANVRYPDVPASWYTNTVRGGTSMVTVRNCSFINFVNGVVVSPGGVMPNGDNVLVTECFFLGNKNCFSSGQTQSRANKLMGCYLLYNQTIVNGQDYGTNQGTVADIINCNIAGGVKYLYQVNGGFSGVNVVNTFAESVYSLGISGDMPVTFTNSQIALIRDDTDEMFVAPVIAEGRQLTFLGGVLEFFDNVNATPFVFNVYGELSFNGTKLRGGAPLNGYYHMGKVKFNSVNFTTADGGGRLDETSQTPNDDISLVVNKHIIPGMNYKLLQGIKAEAVNDKIETVFFEQARIRVNAKRGTAYFISDNPGRYRQYDALAELGSGVRNKSPYDRYSNTQGSLGIVSQVSGDTIKLRYVPYGITDNSVHRVNLVRIPKFLPRILGDVQSGSNVIRNVQVYGGIIYAGSRVKGVGIPDGAYVTQVGSGTLTISMPAIATATNNPVYDAKVVFSSSYISAGYPYAVLPIIYPGDYIDAEFSNTGAASDSIARWYCIRAGISGGNPAPVWRGLKFNDGSSGGGGSSAGMSGTYTPTVTIGTNVDRAVASVSQYMRVGNIVSVSGELQVDTKNPGAFEVGLSLPVPADIANSSEASGTAASSGSVMLRLSGDATNNRVRVAGVAANGNNTAYSFMFTYKL